MRRNMWITMTALLLASLVAMPVAVADDMGLSGQELYDLVVSMFEQHGLHHDALEETELLASAGNEDVLMRGKAPAEGYGERVIGCIDIGYSTTRDVPRNKKQAEALLDEVLADAQAIQDAEEAELFNAEQLETLRDEGMQIEFATSQLWLTGLLEEANLVVMPFYMQDAEGEVIDGGRYFMMLLSGNRGSQIWICSDQDVVFDYYKAVDLDKGDEDFLAPILSWMRVYRREIGGELDEDGNVIPEGRVGKVEISADGSVNIREEAGFDAPIVGKAKAQERFDCFDEITVEDKSVWYEVLLPNGDFGYLPSSFVRYTEDS